MKIVYIGPKPQFTVMFPIPTVSKAEVQETVQFERTKTIEVKDRWGTQALTAMPDFFKEVKDAHPQPKGL